MLSKKAFVSLSRHYKCTVSAARKQFLHDYNSHIEISDEVKCCLHEQKPLVALESTIITHGMPYPDNITCALAINDIVKQQGAIPATIAIIKGKVKVGLTNDELDVLGNPENKAIKTSRRDMSYVISNKLNGGTTVSGTVLIANKIGIPIFATGGIGGVHRDVHDTFDISADLTELGRSRIAIVSSGVKSILDIGKTLEYLETQGVLVCNFGSDHEFPAFFTRKSGHSVPYYIQTAKEAANIIKSQQDMCIESAILFAAPIPEEHAVPDEVVNSAIQKALQSATQNVRGKNITPYLLSEVMKHTKGSSLESNIALVQNNACIAADIAVELQKLSAKYSTKDKGDDKKWISTSEKRPVIIGGSILDCSAKIDIPEIKLDGRTYDTKFTFKAGGVARNICEAMYKLGVPTNFLSVIGDDSSGNALKRFIPPNCSRFVKVSRGRSTAQCIVLFDRVGECKLMMGDMTIHQDISKEMVTEMENTIKDSPILILDANLSLDAMGEALRLAKKHTVPVFYEPTDISHAVKAFKTTSWSAIKFITPNFEECKQIASFFNLKKVAFDKRIQEAAYIANQINEYVENVIVTLGTDGVIIARRGGLPTESFKNIYPKETQKFVRHYPCVEAQYVKNVSGAGDNFASGFLAAVIANSSEEVCMSVGFAAARLALFSESAVPDQIFDKSHESWSQKANYIDVDIL